MKITKLLPLAGLLLSCGAAWATDTLDSEGYPVMYVRGTMTDKWSAQEAFKLTRVGDVYSITLPALDGEFKVSGDDWQFNYGYKNSTPVIDDAMTIEAGQDGNNFVAKELKDVTIKYQLKRNSNGSLNDTYIQISANGHEAPAIPEKVIETSGTLPVLYINVYNEDGSDYNDEIISPNLSHKNYFAGEYWLDVNGCQWLIDLGAESVGSKENPLPLEIKARGNFTRLAFSKKPFKLKLGAKQELLGMSNSKHYAILAHADDNFGYMRNFTGFNLGKRIGLPWTPSQQPVEVVINDDYRGLYFLTESIRIEKKRINITELEDNVTDPALASGGYLIELDNYDEDNQIRMEEKGCVGGYRDMLRITWDTPEEYSEIQKRFVTDQFTAMNNYVGANSDQLWSYMDLDDAARYYIVEEIISHVEAYHGSTYMFRDHGEGQKWHFSPLWDCGNAFNGSTDRFFYNNSPFGNTWIPSMRQNATFNKKVKETWLWFMNTGYASIYDDLKEYAEHLTEAAKTDRKRWKDAPLPDYESRQSVVDNTDMQGRLNKVIDHLKAKTEWLKKQFGDYTVNGTNVEPIRDNTPAAPLPEYIEAGVDNITIDPSVPAEYFNLQGIKVSNPIKGNLYIVRQGDNTVKMVF